MYCVTSPSATDLSQRQEDTVAKISTSDTLASVHGRAPSDTILYLLSILMLWRWRARCRRELATLTDRQMRDAGLDRDFVRRESWKPFWRA
jgi:uncharacterized protein YjiS (DUF1127 family)